MYDASTYSQAIRDCGFSVVTIFRFKHSPSYQKIIRVLYNYERGSAKWRFKLCINFRIYNDSYTFTSQYPSLWEPWRTISPSSLIFLILYSILLIDRHNCLASDSAVRFGFSFSNSTIFFFFFFSCSSSFVCLRVTTSLDGF